MSRAPAIAAALLAGCATLTGSEHDLFPLLPPASLGASVVAQQRVASDRGAMLDAVVRVTPERLTVIGLGPLGQRLLTIDYDGARIDVQPPDALPEGVEPRRLLADLQQAFWPLPSLQRALDGTRWTAAATAAGVREIRHGDAVHAEIRYSGASPWDGHATLMNRAQGYTLDIDSRRLP